MRAIRWAPVLAAAILASACTAPPRPSDGRQPDPPPQFDAAAVAADHPLASAAGAEILLKGGNAVDAAVATGFALSVVRPYSCGIGGGGFMLIHLVDDPRTADADDAVTIAIDYRERAPAAITPAHFESLPDHAPRASGHAVAIPGTVAGLLDALERFGTMDRATIMAPAIRLASRGWEPDPHHADVYTKIWGGDDPPVIPDRSALLVRALGADRIRNPWQAVALRRIARLGRDGFYRGPIAEAIVRAVAEADGPGILTLDDLATYEPTEARPLIGGFRDFTILAMPLPSSGGITIIQILGMLQARPTLIAPRPRTDPEDIHALAEVLQLAFADRAAWLGDPEFTDVPVDRLIDPAYLADRAALVDPGRTHPAEAYGPGATTAEDGGTSHFSVVDAAGNAVACTETINLEYGSKIVVPEYGFFLNNQMDDFQTRRGAANAFGLMQSDANLPGAGKRPLSSMSPTIVLGPDGAVEVVIGASGGPRIISSTVQVLLNILVRNDDAELAVTRPRFHHQWLPPAIWLEPGLLDGDAGAERIAALEALGYEVRERPDVGAVQVIRRAGDGWDAAADPRKGGIPAGY